MARGGRRPGAGRKPKSLASHRLAGTFRANGTGTGPRPRRRSCRCRRRSQPVDWRPSEAEVQALSPLAQTWLSAALTLYQLDALEGQRLLEALRVLSRVGDSLDPRHGVGRRAGAGTAAVHDDVGRVKF